MKTVVINYFTGTKTVALSLNAAQYITLYDNASNDITDSNIISVNRYADSVVVSISSDNILDSAFPLRLVYFNYIDTNGFGTQKLFDQAQATPASSDCFAIGKRNATAKNVSLSDLSDFITDSGDAYIKKASNLADIQAQKARENLSVYDKNHIDRIPSDYVSNADDFRNITTYQHFANAAIYTSGTDVHANMTVENLYQSGIMSVSFKFTDALHFGGGVAAISSVDVPIVLGDSYDFISAGFQASIPLIMQPQISGLIGETCTLLGISDGGFWHGSTVLQTLSALPYLIVTGSDAFKWRNADLQANKVYMVFNMYSPYVNIALLTLTLPDEKDVIYSATYTPNDSQLN